MLAPFKLGASTATRRGPRQKEPPGVADRNFQFAYGPVVGSPAESPPFLSGGRQHHFHHPDSHSIDISIQPYGL
ncbi:uncharacterized protein BO97DRAFT_67925 [Aspergillus homomorphus CBS 101889]|uniref:Uncharacterized protein n=1 Tax=Aspergillus homomorphus (strain CBS 101889) TaxID=1450537 RepID=A0A395HW10_ASPHC|nr:hypothetical protein BO97DRAFT_67925 [Aspergillus homomorphus CBS 101889]RAL11987.1 hypothetical protein BO97DRAFT_67925 [Aspergillus homomorphus CBS 101889]